MNPFRSLSRTCLVGLSTAALLLATACSQEVLIGQGGAGGAGTAGAGGAGTDGVFLDGCLQIPRDTCSVQASLTAPLQLSGSVDGVYREDYSCLALFENHRSGTEIVTDDRVEFLQADVNLTTNEGQTIILPSGSPAQSTVPFDGYVNPASKGAPGLGLASILLLDSTTVAALTTQAVASGASQQVVAHVTVLGKTMGGIQVTTNELVYPIEVAAGSTCTQPVGDACVDGVTKPAADCMLGQDAPADCRLLGAQDACKFLDCDVDPSTMKSDLSSAHCPVDGGAGNGSCCHP